MNMLTTPPMAGAPDSVDKHWRALFSGAFFSRQLPNGQRHTCMGKTMHYGPLRVQRPFYPEGNDLLHLYLLHPPGGLVGGDELSINVKTSEGAKVLVTTPSAGKLYRNETQMQQGQHVHIIIEPDSAVEYLPQENIIFNGAKGTLNTLVELKGDGLFIGWEITCLGRPEGEALFNEGCVKQSLMIKQDGKPLFTDRLILNANDGMMASQVGLQGKTTFGTFVINRNIDSQTLEKLVELQGTLNAQSKQAYVAATQKPGVLIIRGLGERAEPIRIMFEKIWQLLRPCVHGREMCVPRIWNT
ncbi:urease accessory protein UreD [Oceaniserpentilla sp. 4NH20-0058]|uniref:urease accessory protein UreD n=1 Tax=Oceaniserpentilla sp. 4NH20-0058 TaxID=3127660 RepID=UPI003103A4D0